MKNNTIIVFMLLYILFHYVQSKKPNVIVFLTDDQDLVLNGMLPMGKTQYYLADKGVTFQNAFVNVPICCPSRSTILTGQFPHNTGVRNNSIDGNCNGDHWRNNVENGSIAALLNNTGYINFYAGKYLNQYGMRKAGGVKHIPVGWHWWYGLVGNSRYNKYYLSENGTIKYYRNSTNDYLTDVIKNKALNFLDQKHLKNSPFFMVLSTPAPHAPFTPAQRHSGLYPNVTALKTPSFNYTPTDKHWLLKMPPMNLPSNSMILDVIQQLRFESLLAVDELVEAIVKKLMEINELDNTYLIYTSDNGFHIGQFGQPWDKRQPYDTDIRVPLVIRGPNLKQKFLSALPVQTVDFAPTILEMAGVDTPEYMDGKSFLGDLLDEQIGKWVDFEKNILIEYQGEGNERTNDRKCPWGNDFSECSVLSWCKCQDSRNNTYSCVRRLSVSDNFLFCKFNDNENFHEAYDLTEDLYQLENIYRKLPGKTIQKYQNLLKKLISCKGKDCRI